ncbi:glycosyltransferase family 2 protein [Sharpea azabuensis]|uniref:glycosyltransferase family 2 protein n=1 Tax=Sharpea azabuensis TaxID=322505 RepID=UPI0013DBA0C8|nr:glycosyltransferase family 2 protein [Sharpea azabuensis]
MSDLKKLLRKTYHTIVPSRIKNRVTSHRLHKMEEISNECYEQWITNYESKLTHDETFEYNPKISIVVPVYNVLDKHLIPCIESVINQTYTNWELCLADDNSSWENVRKTLEKYESNPKIKVVYRKENGHISRSTNSAIEVATGEFIGFMDCDDILSPYCLYEIVKKLNENKEIDFLYTDEDKVDDDGNHRHGPHFKPDWSPDLLMSHMYTGHFGVYRTSIVNKIGGLRVGYEGSQDYDFTLRFVEQTSSNRIAHIPQVLYYWVERKESTAGNAEAKPYVYDAAKRAKEDAVKRRGLNAIVEEIPLIHQYRVNYISKDNPLVSIIIPSKDNFDILKQCIDSIINKTYYKNYEIIVVDNGSDSNNRDIYQAYLNSLNAHYIYDKKPFNFSYMCNTGASHANGEYLLFLNDDVEVIDGEWLERMVGHGELDYVGAVGAKLLYPNSKTIQHDGIINIKSGPTHVFIGMSDEGIYYFAQNKVDYDAIAVTAACLLVSRDKFNEVQGFREEFDIAYNDVDLCMKLVEKGYYNVVKNDVILYHHESISRGSDLVDEKKLKRLEKERKRLFQYHPQFLNNDPFYSKYFTQESINYSYNFYLDIDHFNTVNESLSQLDKIDSVQCSIDGIDINDTLNISGWAFKKGEFLNDLQLSILLVNNTKTYELSTDKVYRPDVASAFVKERNIYFCGFKTKIMTNQLKYGNYRLYLKTKYGIVDTNRSIDVEN